MTDGFAITRFELEFIFNKPQDVMNELLKQFAQSNFQLERMSEIDLRFQRIGELLPRMSFRSKTQTMYVDIGDKNLTINVQPPFSTFTEKDKKIKEKAFDKEELAQFNADINYILSSLMGVLHVQKLPTTIDIEFLSKNFKYNFEHLLAKNIVIDNKVKTSMTGIQLDSMREIFGNATSVMYRFYMDKDTPNDAKGLILLKQELGLPIHLDKMVYTLKDEFDSILNQVSKH